MGTYCSNDLSLYRSFDPKYHQILISLKYKNLERKTGVIVNIIGALANLTSLILWLPQAKITWNNRNNKQALSGISIWTQLIVSINTVMWCIYGVMIDNVWLPIGTIMILPLAVMTIVLKMRLNRNDSDQKRVRNQ